MQGWGVKWRGRSQIKGTLLDRISILLEASGAFVCFCRPSSLMAVEDRSKAPQWSCTSELGADEVLL